MIQLSNKMQRIRLIPIFQRKKDCNFPRLSSLTPLLLSILRPLSSTLYLRPPVSSFAFLLFPFLFPPSILVPPILTK